MQTAPMATPVRSLQSESPNGKESLRKSELSHREIGKMYVSKHMFKSL